MIITHTINRTGEFTVKDSQAHDFQCGHQRQTHYKYHVAITAEGLTPDGYVMENAWITSYWEDLYVKDGKLCETCELMTQNCILWFVSLFKSDSRLKGVTLLEIYVRLDGSPVSYIEARWRRE